METRNITITLEKAREWYNSDNESLKELALQAFDEKELKYDFRNITTFKDACEALGCNYDVTTIFVRNIAEYSKASAAMFKLNIIRMALNLGYDLHLTENPEKSIIYYPYIPFFTENSKSLRLNIERGKMEVIGKIKSEGNLYKVMGGHADYCGNTGIGHFSSEFNMGSGLTSIGFLGCATKEIARHFGKYFGMLITEAKYADMVDFEIIEDKYSIK